MQRTRGIKIDKRKIAVISIIAAIFLLAAIYFFPKPLESKLSAPLDENCVIYITYNEIAFNQGKPNKIISYKAECTGENGLIDEAIELFTDTKVISNPVNLLPWKITRWDGYDIKVAIGRPGDTGEWMNFGEKEMIISKGEFKIYRIVNRDFANRIIEFTKEYGTLEE